MLGRRRELGSGGSVVRFGAAGADFVRVNFATSPDILDAGTARMAAAR